MKQRRLLALLFVAACARSKTIVVERIVHVHHYHACPMLDVPVYLTSPCDPTWTADECARERAGDETYYAQRLTWWAIDVHTRCAPREGER